MATRRTRGDSQRRRARTRGPRSGAAAGRATGRRTARGTAAKRGRATGRARGAARGRATKKWSRHVMETSNALDLEASVFKRPDPRAIAASLKRSALRSKRRKAAPYQSAMSMLNFYINRAGRGLSARQQRVLERAKGELRRTFERDPKPRAGRSRS